METLSLNQTMNPYDSFTTGIQVGSTKIDTFLHGHFSTANKKLLHLALDHAELVALGFAGFWKFEDFSMYQTYEDTVAPNPDWSLSHQAVLLIDLRSFMDIFDICFSASRATKTQKTHTHPKFDFYIKLPRNETMVILEAFSHPCALPEAPDSW